MSIYYNGQHTISFYDYCEIDETNKTIDLGAPINTWDYFHLVPSSRPYVTVPNPRIQFVTLPRSSRVLDVTNFYTKDVTYEAREGDWEFYIDHDQWPDWTQSFDALSEYFDGAERYVVLEDQENYIYHGRVYLKDYKANADYSTVMIHYDLDATAIEMIIDKTDYKIVSDKNISFSSRYEIDTHGWIEDQTNSIKTIESDVTMTNPSKVTVDISTVDSSGYLDTSLTYLFEFTHGNSSTRLYYEIIPTTIVPGKRLVGYADISHTPVIQGRTLTRVNIAACITDRKVDPSSGTIRANITYTAMKITINKSVII